MKSNERKKEREKEKYEKKKIQKRVCTCRAGGNSQLFPTKNFPRGSHACTRAHASPVKVYGNFGAVALAPECFV